MIRAVASLSIPLALLLAGPVLAAEPMAPPGAPAGAFPKPDRPVAEIVAPRWSSEAERDRAGEFEAVAQGMGIAAGETVADIGAGSGYYVVRLTSGSGRAAGCWPRTSRPITSRSWRSAWRGAPT